MEKSLSEAVTPARLQDAVRKNLAWFTNSGLMNPADGSWGVGERMLRVPDPAMKAKILREFSSYTDSGDFIAVEARRADCNFQLALYELLAADWLNLPEAREIAANILAFLYGKSGLLSRNSDVAPEGVWNWSHAIWRRAIWFDDNSWVLIAQCIILRRYPDLAAQFDIAVQATKLANELAAGFRRTQSTPCHREDPDKLDPEELWNGRLYLPHWGGLAVLALTAFDAWRGTKEFAGLAEGYFTSPETKIANNSERCYALLTAPAAAEYYQSAAIEEVVKNVAAEVLAKLDPASGNLAAEHYEAPSGGALVDLIYTMNWLPGALQNVAAKCPGLAQAKERAIALLLAIQDESANPAVKGCWRGMFDLESGTWGGGDRTEGGAGSIYSGWTNAPIGLWLLLELKKSSLKALCLGEK